MVERRTKVTPDQAPEAGRHQCHRCNKQFSRLSLLNRSELTQGASHSTFKTCLKLLTYI